MTSQTFIVTINTDGQVGPRGLLKITLEEWQEAEAGGDDEFTYSVAPLTESAVPE